MLEWGTEQKLGKERPGWSTREGQAWGRRRDRDGAGRGPYVGAGGEGRDDRDGARDRDGAGRNHSNK